MTPKNGWRSLSDVLEENEDRAAKVAARHAGLRKGKPVDCPAPECSKTEGHIGRHNKQGRAVAVPPQESATSATTAAGEVVEVVVKLRVPLEDLIRIARKGPK